MSPSDEHHVGTVADPSSAATGTGIGPIADSDTAETDPITIELVRNVLLSVIREMRADIVKTAFGSQIKEAEDFSCALMSGNGELIGITQGTPVHLLPGTLAVRGALERYGTDIAPGDVIMVNDPYLLSSHLNDVAFLAPYFEEGEACAWISVRGHYLDIGGMTLGSISPVATDIHQEGLRIPFVKVHEAGVPNQAVLDMMWANIRLPEERELDVAAMLGAMRLAERRLVEVYKRYDKATIEACVRALMDRAEKSMRAAISRLPRGEYAYHHFVESTKEPDTVHRINVRLVIGDDDVVVDLSGSSPQALEPVNGGEATGPGAAFVALKALLDPTTPFNGGSFRPIKVIAEKGSILRSTYPAACGCSSLTMYTGGVAVAGALAEAVGEAMCSHGSWGMTHTYITGWDHERNKENMYFDMSTGGSAATHGQDGFDATANYDKGDFGWFVSTETIENIFPTLLVERNELWTDSGGAGAARGGLGVRRCLRLLDAPASVTCLMDPAVIPPWGVFGGYSGAPWQIHILRDGQRIRPGKVPGKCVEFELQKGDLIEKCTMGAGGYGDPLDRDLSRVAADAREGYISRESARTVYGVALADGTFDQEASDALRARIRQERIHVRLEVEREDDGRDVLVVSPELRLRIGAAEGEIIEMATPVKASVRAWLAVDPELSGTSVSMSRGLRETLNIDIGQDVWIRTLFGFSRDLPS